MWYAEVSKSNKGLVSSFSGSTGHYTQIVWRSTTAIGCGTSGSLLVCQYGPPGNHRGKFDKNVNGPVKSMPSCQSGPGSRPSPRPKPTPAPGPKPLPPNCVDKDPTRFKFVKGKDKGVRARCWQLKCQCKTSSMIREECCLTCHNHLHVPPTPGPTPAPLPPPSKPANLGQITRCSFEDAQLPYCKIWNQVNGDQFDWSRGSRTPSTRTGPSRAKDGKRFLYIETSLPRKSGDRAILQSEMVSIGSGGLLSFNYHMHGVNVGWLKVDVTSQNVSRRVWFQRGKKGNVWKAATVSLSKYAGKDVQIEFAAAKANSCGSWAGDIAIDNVVLDRGASTKQMPTSAPNAAPTPAPTAAPTAAPTPAPTAAPTAAPTTMVPATPPTMLPSSNSSLPEALKILTKRVNSLDTKIDVVLKKVLGKPAPGLWR